MSVNTKEIRYNMKFMADTEEVKKALKDLQFQLDLITNRRESFLGKDDSKHIQDMAKSAKELQTHLSQSFDSTGNFNLSKFQSSLKSTNTDLTQLSKNLINGGQVGQAAFANLAKSVAHAQVPVGKMNGLLGELWYTFKNTIKWGISSSIFNNLTSSLQQAVGYSKNLNTSLNDIRIVTGKSADDMKRFATYANNAAKDLSATTLDMTKASLIYYQQGDTEDIVKEKANITIKATNVSPNSDADEMSEYLTAVWNGYQAVAGEYESYVDKLAAVGAATASSLEEVATGMQKVASTANTVGVDFDQLNAILSTVSSVTREAPESTGTAFKTIFARLQDLKLGETDEDGIDLGKVSQTLNQVGVQVLDINGELIDAGAIIEQLMGKWNDFDRATKVAVAEQLAG